MSIFFLVHHCQALLRLYNGTYNQVDCDLNGLDYDGVCEPTCDTGHYLAGNSTFRCNDQGQWTSSDYAQCISMNILCKRLLKLFISWYKFI